MRPKSKRKERNKSFCRVTWTVDCQLLLLLNRLSARLDLKYKQNKGKTIWFRVLLLLPNLTVRWSTHQCQLWVVNVGRFVTLLLVMQLMLLLLLLVMVVVIRIRRVNKMMVFSNIILGGFVVTYGLIDDTNQWCGGRWWLLLHHRITASRHWITTTVANVEVGIIIPFRSKMVVAIVRLMVVWMSQSFILTEFGASILKPDLDIKKKWF